MRSLGLDIGTHSTKACLQEERTVHFFEKEHDIYLGPAKSWHISISELMDNVFDLFAEITLSTDVIDRICLSVLGEAVYVKLDERLPHLAFELGPAFVNPFSNGSIELPTNVTQEYVYSCHKIRSAQKENKIRPIISVRCVEDFILEEWCGYASIARSSCIRTGMYDPTIRDWNVRTLSDFGLNKSHLPNVVEEGTLVGTMSDTVASKYGLRNNPVIYQGGWDQYLALYAADLSAREGLVVYGSVLVVSFWASESVCPSFSLNSASRERYESKNGIADFYLIYSPGLLLDWNQNRPSVGHKEVKFVDFDTLTFLATDGEEFTISNIGETSTSSLRTAIICSSAFLVRKEIDNVLNTLRFSGGAGIDRDLVQLFTDCVGISIRMDPSKLHLSSVGSCIIGSQGSKPTFVLQEFHPVTNREKDFIEYHSWLVNIRGKNSTVQERSCQ